eukprot:Nk52_evm2s2226 gene=Nk52_evmTU2s2226
MWDLEETVFRIASVLPEQYREQYGVSFVSTLYTVVLLIISYLLTALFSRNLKSAKDRNIILWLVWDALIHFTLEGPFVYISLVETVATSRNPLAIPWKEYGKADIRWLHSDETIVSLEILTVILDGALCLYLVYAYMNQTSGRHYWMIVLCTAELYGGWMTFVPEFLTGNKNLVTDNPLFLWFYLVFFNGLWVIIPLYLMLDAWRFVSVACEQHQHSLNLKKTQ